MHEMPCCRMRWSHRNAAAVGPIVSSGALSGSHTLLALHRRRGRSRCRRVALQLQFIRQLMASDSVRRTAGRHRR